MNVRVRVVLGLALCFTVLLTGVRGQATVYAPGCACLTQPIPVVSHSGSLITNSPQTISISGLMPDSVVIMFWGLINEDLAGDVLAFSLDGLVGFENGCFLNTTWEVLILVDTADGAGNYDFVVPLKLGAGPNWNFQFVCYENLDPVQAYMSPAINLHIPMVLDPDVDPLDML